MTLILDINRRILRGEIAILMTSLTFQFLIMNKIKVSKSTRILKKIVKKEVSILIISTKKDGLTMRLRLIISLKTKILAIMAVERNNSKPINASLKISLDLQITIPKR